MEKPFRQYRIKMEFSGITFNVILYEKSKEEAESRARTSSYDIATGGSLQIDNGVIEIFLRSTDPHIVGANLRIDIYKFGIVSTYAEPKKFAKSTSAFINSLRDYECKEAMDALSGKTLKEQT